jgi:hypothetical protein
MLGSKCGLLLHHVLEFVAFNTYKFTHAILRWSFFPLVLVPFVVLARAVSPLMDERQGSSTVSDSIFLLMQMNV